MISERILAAAIVIATAAAAAAIGSDCAGRPARERADRVFQSAVLGVGIGPAIEPSDCPEAFDARIANGCPRRLFPLPGGEVYCPFHALSISRHPQSVSGDVDIRLR